MKAHVVLDFDGVVLDSLYEKFFVGFNAYLELQGGSPLLGGAPLEFRDYLQRVAGEPELFQAFRELVPLIGDLGENAAAFRLIESGQRYPDRDAFVVGVEALGRSYLDSCSAAVTRLRNEYAAHPENDVLCPGFSLVVETVSTLVDSVAFSICTTKPLENVRHFSRQLGVAECFDEIRVCPDHRRKVDLLVEMTDDRSLSREQILFVDDFARHLLPAEEAGFSSLFANWGYGGIADRSAVRQAGIPAIEIDEFPGALAAFRDRISA